MDKTLDSKINVFLKNGDTTKLHFKCGTIFREVKKEVETAMGIRALYLLQKLAVFTTCCNTGTVSENI